MQNIINSIVAGIGNFIHCPKSNNGFALCFDLGIIRITILKGLSAFGLELSINYNSNSGNGLLGVGFGLGGMRFNNKSVLIVNSLLSVLIFIIVNPRLCVLFLQIRCF
jgi:hypothetical protein